MIRYLIILSSVAFSIQINNCDYEQPVCKRVVLLDINYIMGNVLKVLKKLSVILSNIV